MEVRRHTQSEDIPGKIPYRMAFAGGWIDQPFVSRLNPNPPGSMVVVGLKPTFRWMERSGMATGTRKAARRLWGERIPDRDRNELVRQLYQEENRDLEDPSGSQDMIGLIYSGVNRLDYDARYEGGVFPCHIESECDPKIANWLESVIHVVPVAQRPPGYNPLGQKNLDPSWIDRLGQTGRDCFAAIVECDLERLGQSFNDCMLCWETLLPDTVRHSTVQIDLLGILRTFQDRYPGAMYSGCGGGYVYVVSEQTVPGSFRVQVRTS